MSMKDEAKSSCTIASSSRRLRIHPNTRLQLIHLLPKVIQFKIFGMSDTRSNRRLALSCRAFHSLSYLEMSAPETMEYSDYEVNHVVFDGFEEGDSYERYEKMHESMWRIMRPRHLICSFANTSIQCRLNDMTSLRRLQYTMVWNPHESDADCDLSNISKLIHLQELDMVGASLYFPKLNPFTRMARLTKLSLSFQSYDFETRPPQLYVITTSRDTLSRELSWGSEVFPSTLTELHLVVQQMEWMTPRLSWCIAASRQLRRLTIETNHASYSDETQSLPDCYFFNWIQSLSHLPLLESVELEGMGGWTPTLVTTTSDVHCSQPPVLPVLPALTRLNMDCSLTCSIWKWISSHKLKSLSVQYGLKGMSTDSEALRHLTDLQELRISASLVSTSKSNELLNTLHMIRAPLHTLSFSSYSIGNLFSRASDLKTCFGHLSTLTEVDVGYCVSRSLLISSSHVCDAWSHLSTTLTHLGLSAICMDDRKKVLETIVNTFPLLQTLKVANCGLCDDDVMSLTGLRSLTSLNIFNNPSITADSFTTFFNQLLLMTRLKTVECEDYLLTRENEKKLSCSQRS